MGIAAAVIALLAPYLVEAGKSIAGKAGDVAVESVKALHHAIRAKFADDGDELARGTLERLEAQPESETWKQSLTELLDEKVKADPAFARELGELLGRVPGVHVRLVGNVQEIDVTNAKLQVVDVVEGVDVSVDASLTGSVIRGEHFEAQNLTVRKKTES